MSLLCHLKFPYCFQNWLVVFHWSPSNSKSFQVSGTFFSIQTHLKNTLTEWLRFVHASYIHFFECIKQNWYGHHHYYDFYYYYHAFKIFHISVSWWSFTGVWVTASLLKSPGLFSVFWPFSIILSFGWSPLVPQLQSPPGPLLIL